MVAQTYECNKNTELHILKFDFDDMWILSQFSKKKKKSKQNKNTSTQETWVILRPILLCFT